MSSHGKKKNTGKTIACIVFSFLLSIFVSIAAMLMAIKIGFFNKELIFESFDKVNFYYEVQQEIYKQMGYEIVPTGLETNLLDGTISIEKVHEDINAYIEACFDNKEYTIDTAEIEEAIYENIMEQFNNMDRQNDPGTQEHAKKFVSNIIEKYPELIEFPYMRQFADTWRKVDLIVMIVIGLAVVMGLFCAVFLILLQRWKHRSLRYITYATLASALMTVGLPAYLLIGKSYKGLGIKPVYLYNFCMAYIDASLYRFVWVGTGLLGVSILFMCIIKLMRRRLHRRGNW